MTPRAVARLALLAETAELRLRDEVRRHSAALDTAAQQRQVLAIYRSRLGQSWREGAVVDAGLARRAVHFAVATQAAETQVDQFEQQARQQLAQAIQRLAQAQLHSRNLAGVQKKTAAQAAATAEQKLEAARPVPPQRG